MTEMVFWLVLHMFGNGSSTSVVPTPYSTEAACRAAAKAYDDEANSFMYGASSECLPMPRADLQLSNIRGIVQP